MTAGSKASVVPIAMQSHLLYWVHCMFDAIVQHVAGGQRSFPADVCHHSRHDVCLGDAGRALTSDAGVYFRESLNDCDLYDDGRCAHFPLQWIGF